jgi:hypothetical protein
MGDYILNVLNVGGDNNDALADGESKDETVDF